MHPGYKRLSIEFPAEEYIYLKMACAKKGVSIKDFVTQSVVQTIKSYEDELDALAFKEAYTKENLEKAVSWTEAKKEVDIDHRKDIYRF